jgi:hypothetical protein
MFESIDFYQGFGSESGGLSGSPKFTKPDPDSMGFSGSTEPFKKARHSNIGPLILYLVLPQM